MEFTFSSFILCALIFVLGLIFGAASQVKKLQKNTEILQMIFKFLEMITVHNSVSERLEILKLAQNESRVDEKKFENILRVVYKKPGAS